MEFFEMSLDSALEKCIGKWDRWVWTSAKVDDDQRSVFLQCEFDVQHVIKRHE